MSATIKKRTWIIAFILLLAVALYAYRKIAGSPASEREGMLALLPSDSSAALFADFDELRHSPFFAQLYAWAPRGSLDPGYAEFLRATDFDYERDLHRIAIAILKHGQDTALFAIVDARFDRKKITAYALQTGKRENFGGREIFTVPLGADTRKLSFTFLRDDRIAVTQDTRFAPLFSASSQGHDAREWHDRFLRLAGSPLFAVIRQDAGVGSALATQAPGGVQSPQLSGLLDQLQWITVAGKLESDRLQIVAEGECSSDAGSHQLADLLNGMIVLAQAGLNGPQTRQQLHPQVREAYLELLQGAGVSRLDRGDTKSVRLIFDVTAKTLEAAKTVTLALPASPPAAAPASSGPSGRAAPVPKTKMPSN